VGPVAGVPASLDTVGGRVDSPPAREDDRRGDAVPTSTDVHDDLEPPPEAVQQIGDGARAGAVEEFGVGQIDLSSHPEGTVYCLLDAPDEEAVHRHHAALDVPCGEVHRVDRLG
jgi:uncharacterized protein DUF4242